MSKQSLNPDGKSYLLDPIQSSEPVGGKPFYGSNNRRMVVVDQSVVKMQYTEETKHNEPRLSKASSHDSLTDCHVIGTENQDDTILSSPDGSIDSRSSLLIGGYNTSGTSADGTTESKILDELKADIESTAVQHLKFLSEVEEIPKLKMKMDASEKEKKVMKADISEKNEIIRAMKQRLSVLHEQNSQLAQLTKSSHSGPSETLKIRNALVASLAQLKKLQVQADELPELKLQISIFKKEIAELREQKNKVLEKFSINIPEGVTPQDYNNLMEENARFKKCNDGLSADIKSISKSAEMVSSSIEGLKRRVDNFGKSSLNSIPLLNRIKKMENENEELNQKIIDLKLNNSIGLDINTAYLDNECAILRKNNNMLQARLDTLATDYRQQKEKIILKLLDIELSNAQTHTSEVEKKISDIQSDINSLQGFEDGDHATSVVTPHSRAQILKLHQLKLQCEQSRNVMLMVMTENEDLEKKVVELSNKLDVKYVRDLEKSIEEYKNKLVVTEAKIADFEKKLSITTGASYIDSTETGTVRELQTQSASVLELQDKLKEQRQSHEAKYKKVKAQKNKLEKKNQDNKEKFHVIAGELSSSAQLLKMYQAKCSELEKDTKESSTENMHLKDEISTLKDEISTLKAQVEVIRAEHNYEPLGATSICLEDIEAASREESSETKKELHTESMDIKIPEYIKRIEILSEENRILNRRFEEEVADAQKENELKSTELMALQEKFECVKDQLRQTEATLAAQCDSQQALSDEAAMKIAQLEEQRDENYESIVHSKDLLLNKIHVLDEEKLKLSSELKEVMNNCDKLHIELVKVEDESHQYQKQLKLKLSGLLTSIDTCKSEKAEVVATLVAKEEEIKSLRKDRKLKELEMEGHRQTIEALDTSETSIKADYLNQLEQVRQSYLQLENETEGYKAIIKSLQRQVDEAETREIEHENLRHKIKILEKSLGDSSHDNKALIKVLHETMKEIPSQPEQSLRDRNLQLEEQISVLSQWSDKQRQEVEELEILLGESSKTCGKLMMEIEGKAQCAQENVQLKRELKEVEMELNALQMRADMQEELQMKAETQARVLATFDHHNALLRSQVGTGFILFLEVILYFHSQVDELLSQIKELGGRPKLEKAVSPPPMPDVTLVSSSSLEGHGPRYISDLERGNKILKKRIALIEDELFRLNSVSPTVRRHNAAIHVMLSVPIGSINQDVLVK